MSKIANSTILTIFVLLILSFFLELIGPLFFSDRFYLPDVDKYVNMVEFFRGNASISDIPQQFRSRLITPLLASLIPLDSYFSLSIISISFTLLSVLLFYYFLRSLEYNNKLQILGTLLFMIASPTLIDGSVPMTDSTGLFFVLLSLNIFLYFEDKFRADLLNGIILSVGMLAREAVLFIVPVLIIWRIIDEKIDRKKLLIDILLLGLMPTVSLILVRIIIPTSYTWSIDFSRIDSNISNLFEALCLATIAQLTLLSVVGFFGNAKNIFKKSKIVWKLVFGILSFLLYIGYVLLSASISSRFFWPLFIFVIPLFLFAINEFNDDLNKDNN